MHADLVFSLQTQLEDVHDLHQLLEGRYAHVFPTLVEYFDVMAIESFRIVAESSFRDYPISTISMFTWLLQVKHCPDVVLVEPSV